MKFGSFIRISLVIFSFISLFPELEYVLLAIGLNFYFKKMCLTIEACTLGISFEKFLLRTWQRAEARRSWELVSRGFKETKETVVENIIKGAHIFH